MKKRFVRVVSLVFMLAFLLSTLPAFAVDVTDELQSEDNAAWQMIEDTFDPLVNIYDGGCGETPLHGDRGDMDHCISVYYSSDPKTGELIEVPYEDRTPIATVEDGETIPFLIEKDNRFQVGNTTRFPYCTMVEIWAYFKNSDHIYSHGSGVLVGDKTVLTAGHLVWDEDYGSATKITVIPGGSAGTMSTYYANSLFTPYEWQTEFDFEYDYAIINLKESPNVGYLETNVLSTETIEATSFSAYGYPDDKTKGTLWYTTAGQVDKATVRRFTFRGYSSTGMSGGPIMSDNNTNTVVAILSGDGILSTGYKGIVAVRINKSIQNYIAEMSLT